MSSSTRMGELASQTIDTDTTTVGDGTIVDRRHINELGFIQVSGRVDGTFTLSIQESADNATWLTVVTASALTANGIQTVDIPDRHLAYLRVVVTSASTTDGATVQATIMTEQAN